MKRLRVLFILVAMMAMGTVSNAGTNVANCAIPIIFGV
jgi:hypothetical protein